MVSDDGAALAKRVERRLAAGLITATVDGAVTVFLFLAFVVPLPKNAVADQRTGQFVNLGVFAAYLAVSVVFGTTWSRRRQQVLYAWLESGAPAGDRERQRVVAQPREQAVLGLVLWGAAAILFGLVNLAFSARVAGNVASTIALAGLSMAALSYLITERVMRPVVARAFADAVPDQPAGIGVLPRILLTWAFCSGVPLLGVALAHVDRPSAEFSAVSTYFIVGAGLVVGLVGMIFAAKSIAEPLAEVRTAMTRVGAGRVDVGVPVDDASEIGLLQAGFNQMVEGLRERQRLADLFGRHVGVDVAREALEHGVRFEGATRHAAVLFVDVVGSTALAATRRPEEVVARLNEFFTVVVAVVEQHGGWVNKFEGDAALCVFGVPTPCPDANAAALAAALSLRDELRGLAGLDAAIGVAAGTVIAGNVGAEERYEFTVIGDPVNEAARLTELAKNRPERLLASAEVLEAARSDQSTPGADRRWVIDGEVTLRGRPQPTRLAFPAS